jgi:hypothetical protein
MTSLQLTASAAGTQAFCLIWAPCCTQPIDVLMRLLLLVTMGAAAVLWSLLVL